MQHKIAFADFRTSFNFIHGRAVRQLFQGLQHSFLLFVRQGSPFAVGIDGAIRRYPAWINVKDSQVHLRIEKSLLRICVQKIAFADLRTCSTTYLPLYHNLGYSIAERILNA
jgi:hypothetical protein